MNCQEFAIHARDLARNQENGALLDAALLKQGLAHAQQCPACAARLTDERQLSAGLRAWALEDETLAASGQVESAVLAAFRQQQRPVSTLNNLIRPTSWAWAVAAVVLLSLLVWAMRSWLPGTPNTVPPAATLAHVSPTAQNTPAPGPVFVASEPKQNTAQLTTNSVRVAARAKHAKPRYRIERYLVESEIATDFLPLMDQSTWPKREGMQTLRVEMPRTVLASFGLPMSFERATEPIQAELLIGADGLARAIRFIQTNLEEPQIISANTPSSKE